MTIYLKQQYTRFEIAFWAFFIPQLRASRFLQRVLCQSHALFTANSWVMRIPRPVLWLSAGLTMGLVIGVLSALVTP
jgi:hypothetical protein